MSALLKAFTDALHVNELAHTSQNSTTTSGGTQNAGTSSLQVSSTANMPAQSTVDIDTGANLEVIPYTKIIDSTHIQLAFPTAKSHVTNTPVVQWVYALAIGDQVAGIANDGSQAAPTNNNTSTYYVYNAGDQTAQFPVFSVSNASPSTDSGNADTKISITSSGSGFAGSVTPNNLAAGATQQIWVTAEVPNGQSNIPASGQIGVINLQYQSV